MASTAPDSHISHTAANAYWSSIDADVNGMLGGFPYISKVDLQGSKNFVAKLGVDRKLKRAVDCGAGIGRVTNGLLLSIASTVDIVEPIAKFSEAMKGTEGIGRIWNVGLQEWDCGGENIHESMNYDLIWNQWCVGHLTDVQLVEYLVKCGKALADGGWIIVKENLSTSGVDLFDELDSSVTRTEEKFRDLFERAGMQIKRTEVQKGLPKELYPVRTFALQPNA